MKKITLVSLGISCQTTHQLARYAQANPNTVNFQKGPFDWLICPLQSSARWIEAGLPDFHPDEIIIERDHAYWPKFNFWFWHGFYTKSNDGKKLDIKANLQRELEKLDYQRKQFSNLDPKTTLFIASNTQNNLTKEVFTTLEENFYIFSKTTQIKLEENLNNYFNSSVNIEYFSRIDRISADLGGNSKTILLRPEQSEWKGNDLTWNRALDLQVQNSLPNP